MKVLQEFTVIYKAILGKEKQVILSSEWFAKEYVRELSKLPLIQYARLGE